MSKNRAIIDGKDKHTKAIWDDVTLDVFIQVCVSETLDGNKPNCHFSKIGWKNVTKKFNEKTGRDYDYKQLKNKWTALRKDWQVWNGLIGADTRLGWGPLRQTIDATNQWWEDLLKLVPEAFRAKGLQKVDQLDILFKDAAVTGVGAWAPSQGLLQINDNEEGNDNDTVGDTEFDDNDFNNMESVTNDVDASEAASKLSEKLDRMCEVIENRRNDSPGCSILEVMNALKGLPGIVEGDELYMKAADIFVKREYREIFVAIGKPQIQVAWLKQKKL